MLSVWRTCACEIRTEDTKHASAIIISNVRLDEKYDCLCIFVLNHAGGVYVIRLKSGISSIPQGIVYHQHGVLYIIKPTKDARWRVMIYSPQGADDMHRTACGDDIPSLSAWIKKIFLHFWWTELNCRIIKCFSLAKNYISYFFTFHYYLLPPKIDKAV